MSDATTMFDYKGEIFSGRELLAIEVGREIERERIIKLLEDSMANCSKNKEPEGCVACYGQRDAIALIKGEK